MPKWITVLFVFFLSLSLLNAKARTVEDIMDLHIRAMGGKQKITSAVVPDLASLYNHHNKDRNVKLEGISQVKDKSCYLLHVHAGDRETYFYVDAETGLLVKKVEISRGKTPQPTAIATEYSDYRRKNNGLVYPQTVISRVIANPLAG
jgi:hypothetical protein